MFSARDKEAVRQELVASLRGEKEIRKIVIFGSFLDSDHPNDVDVAIFQDSAEPYLPLALKYRQRTRLIARKIPVDIIPLKFGMRGVSFLSEIDRGEVIYES